MLNRLVGLWHRIERWMHRGKAPSVYRPSNLDGRHR
jgi:hypothetical protein